MGMAAVLHSAQGLVKVGEEVTNQITRFLDADPVALSHAERQRTQRDDQCVQIQLLVKRVVSRRAVTSE